MGKTEINVLVGVGEDVIVGVDVAVGPVTRIAAKKDTVDVGMVVSTKTCGDVGVKKRSERLLGQNSIEWSRCGRETR